MPHVSEPHRGPPWVSHDLELHAVVEGTLAAAWDGTVKRHFCGPPIAIWHVLLSSCTYPRSIGIADLFNDAVPQLLDDKDGVAPDAESADQPAATGEEDLEASGDFARVVAMANGLRASYEDSCLEEWAGSDLGWIREEVPSSHKRGKIGEELVREWARSEGLSVGGRGSRGHDCVIAGLKIEVKTSLRWNNNRLAFLNLRDFDYHAVALLGLEPNRVQLWIVPKQLLWDHAHDQTRGATGRGSRWLYFAVDRPPVWLERWGGSLAEAGEALGGVARYLLKNQQTIAECESWRDASSGWTWQPGSDAIDA